MYIFSLFFFDKFIYFFEEVFVDKITLHSNEKKIK